MEVTSLIEKGKCRLTVCCISWHYCLVMLKSEFVNSLFGSNRMEIDLRRLRKRIFEMVDTMAFNVDVRTRC